MKKTFTLLLCLLALTALFVSCTGGSAETLAHVRLSVDTERSRTLGGSEISSVTQYRFTLTKTDDTSISYSTVMAKESDGVYDIEGIMPGNYNIFAEALNKDNKVLSTCNLENKYFYKGNNSFTVTFSTLYGNGGLSIALVWNPKAFASDNKTVNPAITATLKAENGDTNINVDVSSDKLNEGKATLTKSDLRAGSYFLTVSFKVGNTEIFSSVDAVRIVDGNTTTGTIDYSKSGHLTQVITIEDNTITPIVGTITANRTYQPGEHGQGGVTFTLTLSNLPSGTSESDVKVKWYGDGFHMSNLDDKKVVTFSPFFGYARYTAVMYVEGKNGSLGSAEIIYNYPL